MGGKQGKLPKGVDFDKNLFRLTNKKKIDEKLPIKITDPKQLFYIEPEDKFEFSVFQLGLHRFDDKGRGRGIEKDPSREVYTKLVCNAPICREESFGINDRTLTEYCKDIMTDSEFILTLSVIDKSKPDDDISNCISYIIAAPYKHPNKSDDDAFDYELKLICSKKGKIPFGLIMHSIMVQFLFNNKSDLQVDNIYLHSASSDLLGYYTNLGYLIGSKPCYNASDSMSESSTDADSDIDNKDILTEIHAEVLKRNVPNDTRLFYSLFDDLKLDSFKERPGYRNNPFLLDIITRLKPFVVSSKDSDFFGMLCNEDGTLMKLCGFDAQKTMKSLSNAKIKKLWSIIYSRNIFTKSSRMRRLTSTYKSKPPSSETKTKKIGRSVSNGSNKSGTLFQLPPRQNSNLSSESFDSDFGIDDSSPVTTTGPMLKPTLRYNTRLGSTSAGGATIKKNKKNNKRNKTKNKH